jgi:serine/threonine-protein kinase
MIDSVKLLQGRYQIVEPIARGGMGAVYLAEDMRLPGRLVAIKENLESAPGSRQQFEREAVILARLRHPSFCNNAGRCPSRRCWTSAMQ